MSTLLGSGSFIQFQSVETLNASWMLIPSFCSSSFQNKKSNLCHLQLCKDLTSIICNPITVKYNPGSIFWFNIVRNNCINKMQGVNLQCVDLIIWLQHLLHCSVGVSLFLKGKQTLVRLLQCILLPGDSKSSVGQTRSERSACSAGCHGALRVAKVWGVPGSSHAGFTADKHAGNGELAGSSERWSDRRLEVLVKCRQEVRKTDDP